tara:strand:+ start:3679 stop:4152 length:474 start_codon:yes stop_codon:yes gene_type:complete
MNTYRNLYIYNSRYKDNPIYFLRTIYNIYRKLDVQNIIYISSYWESLYEDEKEWKELIEEIDLLRYLSPNFSQKIIFSIPKYPVYVKRDTIHSPTRPVYNTHSKSAIISIEGNTPLMDVRRTLRGHASETGNVPLVYVSGKDELIDISESLLGLSYG